MTVQTTDIPRRQKCVNKEHPYIGGAVDLYDDSQNKAQSTINQETSQFMSSKGQANGLASLDNGGKVPSSQLPSYVDDVIEGYYYNSKFYKEAAHTTEITPEKDKIYVDLATDKTYRWSGSAYFPVSNPYAPDEEDLTVNNNFLKLKDKAYSAANFSGLGRVYLRKNIVNVGGTDKNILTQSMINTANTIYIIQYDFDLNDATITIPANCILDFQGGSLSNGNLVLDDTFIICKDCIDCDLTGTIYGGVVNTSIFKDNNNDDKILVSCCAVASTIILQGRTFNLTETISLGTEKTFIGENGNKIICSTEALNTTADIHIYNVHIEATTAVSVNCSYLEISGSTLKSIAESGQAHVVRGLANKVSIGKSVIIGGYCGILLAGGNYEYVDGSYIKITDCEFTGCFASSSIQFSYYNGGEISDNYIHSFRGNGISTTYCKNIVVSDNFIDDYYVSSGSGNGYGIAFSLNTTNSKAVGNLVRSTRNVGGGICSDLFLDNQGTQKTEWGGNEIADNHIEVTTNGIILNGSDNSCVCNNMIYKCTTSFIRCNKSDNAVVDGNIILAQSRIQSVFQNLSLKKLTIKNNSVTIYDGADCDYLYYLSAAEDAEICGNNIIELGTLVSPPTSFAHYEYYVSGSNVDVSNDNILRIKKGNSRCVSASNSKVKITNGIYKAETGYGYYVSGTSSEVEFKDNIINSVNILSTLLHSSNNSVTLKLDSIVNDQKFTYSKLEMVTNGSITKRYSSGTTSDRPSGLLNLEYDLGKRYYDSTINRSIFLDRTIGIDIETVSITANSPLFISNTLQGGVPYNIFKNSWGTYAFRMRFYKENDYESTDYVEVIYSGASVRNYTIVALDPSVYPYICFIWGTSGNITIQNFNPKWIEIDGATAGVARSGATANRPVGSDIYVGFIYMDITLGKPIYASAISGDTVTWVKADGTDPDA